MNRRTWLFRFLLAVPIIGFADAEVIRGFFNSELRSALGSQHPAAPHELPAM